MPRNMSRKEFCHCWRPLSIGTAVALFALSPQVSRADESGVSFWIPGLFGSLAAVPVTPGFSLATIYYHTSVEAGGAVAAARQIQIGTAVQDAQVTGDRILLERLVSNLIDNAVKHNVPGGWVAASTRTNAGIAELTVSNGGEHIPADQVTRAVRAVPPPLRPDR